jgi:hypothetical protein
MVNTTSLLDPVVVFLVVVPQLAVFQAEVLLVALQSAVLLAVVLLAVVLLAVVLLAVVLLAVDIKAEEQEEVEVQVEAGEEMAKEAEVEAEVAQWEEVKVVEVKVAEGEEMAKEEEGGVREEAAKGMEEKEEAARVEMAREAEATERMAVEVKVVTEVKEVKVEVEEAAVEMVVEINHRLNDHRSLVVEDHRLGLEPLHLSGLAVTSLVVEVVRDGMDQQVDFREDLAGLVDMVGLDWTLDPLDLAGEDGVLMLSGELELNSCQTSSPSQSQLINVPASRSSARVVVFWVASVEDSLPWLAGGLFQTFAHFLLLKSAWLFHLAHR